MSRQQGLLQRGTRWFSNIKVPKDLVPAFGKKKICQALGTSDYREACRKIAFERARWAANFETERKKAARHCPQQRTEKALLTTLSKAEAFELASRYLASREGEMRDWMMTKGRFLPDHERQEVAESVDYDAAAYAEGFDDQPLPDGTDELKRFLEGQQIDCPLTSPAFRALRPLIFEAHLEYLQRSGDIVSQNTVKERNPIFRGIHSHSPLAEEVKGYTVDDLIKGRDKAVSGGSLKSKIAAYPAARLLREVLGKNTLLSSISREDVERLFEVMENIPVNAAQRYRGMTYKQAIKAAAKCGDTRKPHTNTNWATYTQINAIFNFGVDAEMIAKNPVSSRIFRKRFQKERSSPRAQFTIDELNALFRAPLYTGCVNDEHSYQLVGPNRPRRGRFWVPLLCLFHGMRNNEACQLYTEDVKEENGIHYVAIREGLDHSKKSEKKLKTPQSARNVPIHPELIRMGFLDFVSERRADRKAPRLFPELEAGRNGYFSDAFSKWFSRFVKEALPGCKATLHSFRHQFRDATRAARISNEVVGRLAGWEHGEKESGLMMHRYGGGDVVMKLLAEDIAKVSYPGIDLSHLYPKPASTRGVPRSAVGRVRDE